MRRLETAGSVGRLPWRRLEDEKSAGSWRIRQITILKIACGFESRGMVKVGWTEGEKGGRGDMHDMHDILWMKDGDVDVLVREVFLSLTYQRVWAPLTAHSNGLLLLFDDEARRLVRAQASLIRSLTVSAGG
jgi:hypothetical protein